MKFYFSAFLIFITASCFAQTKGLQLELRPFNSEYSTENTLHRYLIQDAETGKSYLLKNGMIDEEGYRYDLSKENISLSAVFNGNGYGTITLDSTRVYGTFQFEKGKSNS